MNWSGSAPCQSRVRLEVDLAKIAANFAEVQNRVGGGRVMPVLKANAYGLGVRRIAAMLRDAGAAAFGVAEINEALELTPLGLPVQILGNLLPDEVAPAVEAGLWCPVNDLASAQAVSSEAVRQRKIIDIELAIDSGMGRLGMVAEQAFDQIMAIRQLPNLKLRGIYSHFSSAYMRHDPYNQFQLKRFKSLLNDLAAAGVTFEDVHMAASDALNNLEESYREPFTLARTGINLYGYCDNEFRSELNLRPAIELKTNLAAVRTLEAGSCIGYGRMHKLRREQRIGTIAAGYADGVPLALSNRGYVLVRGVLCPVLGRISMDYTTISLEHVPEAVAGDEVVCVGRQGDTEITLEDWAALKGTHAYELLCSFGTRVKRIYLNG